MVGYNLRRGKPASSFTPVPVGARGTDGAGQLSTFRTVPHFVPTLVQNW